MKEYLDRLDELLSDESKWTKGAYAVDKYGYHCDVKSEQAIRWCLVGAMMRISPHRHGELRGIISYCLGGDSVMDWNDSPKRTFADVKALIARAKEMAVAQTGEAGDG